MVEDINNTGDYVRKILIVDDEVEVSKALAMTLQYAKQFNSEIAIASNAKAALAELKKQDFDIILADYKMPGMNGIELLKKVKEINPGTVRMLITGNPEVKIAREAIDNAEVHYYIEKPWENKNLRMIIYDALKKKDESELEDIKNTKQKMIKWLTGIYNDAKGMGLDLISVEHYVQNAKNAIETNDLDNALTYINHSVNTMITLAETSFPELCIEKLKNVQLQGDQWNKLNFTIKNIGNIDANDIDLLFKGEFDIRSTDTIPVLRVNESKVITIEIYPKKTGIFPLEIELSCKKLFDNSSYHFEESLWIQIGDMVGKTKLKRKFRYEKGYIKMELNITNEDLRDIKDVNLELMYDENILLLSHVKPIYKKINKNFKIGDINPRNGKNIVIYLHLMS